MISFRPKRSPFSLKNQTGFGTIAILCFVMLYAPILTLVVYSFNSGKYISIWEGFSLRWYVSAWSNEAVKDATMRSLMLATQASIFSTVLATMAALGTTRVRPFKGLTAIYVMINQPLMVPEIVTAVALLILFAMIKSLTGVQGMIYLVAAHTAFCIPFAYLPIRARLEGMSLTLETAAADLYATPWKTFRYVTLPLLWPGIIAGGILAFVISLDDVVITEFVKSTGQETLPTYMLGQLRRVISPEINAISTVLLALSISVVCLYFFIERRSNK